MQARSPLLLLLALSAAVFTTGLNDAETATRDPGADGAHEGPAPEVVRRSLPRPQTGRWTYERRADDTPIAQSCNESETACVAVACRGEQGLTFEYFGPGNVEDPDREGGALYVSTLTGVKRFDLDWSFLNQPFERRAPLTEAMAEKLALGGRGLYVDEKRQLPFTLTGSSEAIDAVRLRCR
ncbi:MAG: hypothetical protein AAFY02_08655 [Pseudomonadota bacterium]